MLGQLLLYAFSFVGIWIGAGMAISSVEQLSKKLKLSSFAVSFLILGFFTSISELSVGINAITHQDPEIYVGNLIGASIVIFMMIIPLLAITGRQVQIHSELRGFNLIMALVVVGIPVVLSFDGKIDKIDSFISVILYALLTLIIQTKKGVLEKAVNVTKLKKMDTGKELLKIIAGVVVIFISSHFVVEETMYFSKLLGLSPFFISLIFIGIGTNLPELSVLFRSVFMNSNQVAFGDYVGSAAFNTFLFGMLTFLYGKPVYLTNSYLVSLLFLIVGLVLFYLFAKSKNTISRGEGCILFCLYLCFLATEYVIHWGFP